ncbi:protein of unknown function DUF1292 [Gottschalkia purinilytica]|uniref:UPF0473 protein CLPU_1c00450 n=1 Tax=Gottschalkia purinilytica TaxID=1503 RepID=A0A0L0WEN1_GOTPU|nr:DUF1292 domain-containing protein [Gottschalkia purinilytica]KNF09880.1 protein of unknown function DUF1292 [Gottschalkia purinilytica]
MDNENNIISLIDEEGVEQDFEVIATFDVEENEYAVLYPLSEEDEEAYILKVEYDENGELILTNIEDKDEFDDVVAAYEAIVDEII